MRLRYSPFSPFARKVRVAAAVLGLPLDLEPADTMDATDTLRQQNPLGKIPILVRDAGPALFDSAVIVAYLDHVAGDHPLIPAETEARFATLRLEALADGIMDAALLQVYERRYRPEEKVVHSWLDLQAGKITRTLTELEAAPPDLAPDAGTIALACAFGYLDFRLGGTWRADHPRLVDWYTAFAAHCPGFSETAPG